MWYRDRKIERDNFGRKRKSTGFIYLPGSKLRESEGNFQWGRVYNMLLLVPPLVLENI